MHAGLDLKFTVILYSPNGLTRIFRCIPTIILIAADNYGTVVMVQIILSWEDGGWLIG